MSFPFCRLTLLLIVISFSSCHHHVLSPAEQRLSAITDTLPLSVFSKNETLRFEKTGFSRNDIVTMGITDTFLLLTNQNDPKALSIISTESNRLIGQLIPRGRAKGSCLNIATILNTSLKDIVWLYDVTSVKFLKVNLLKAVNTENYSPEREFSAGATSVAVKSPCWINDSTYAGCSYFSDDSRFLLINDSFQTAKKIGELPPAFPDWPKGNPKGKFGLLALCYSSLLVKHPGKDMYAVPYNKTARIDFYDSSNLVKVIRGPDLFDPVYEFRDYGGVTIPVQNDDTFYSFTAAQADSRYLYLLYSGRKKISTSRKLLILDWKGNLVKLYDLGENYRTFAVMPKDKRTRIYAVNDQTGDLEYSDITL